MLAIRNNCSVYNSIVIAKKTKATVRSSGFLHHISLSKSVEVDLTPLMNTCWFRNSYILQALLSLHISSFMQRNNKGKILVVCRLSYVSNTKTNAPRYALCVEGSISGLLSARNEKEYNLSRKCYITHFHVSCMRFKNLLELSSTLTGERN